MRTFLPIIILLSALAVAATLVLMKPKPEVKEVEEKLFLVDVIDTIKQDITYSVSSQGTVQPKVTSALSPQVSGIIKSVSAQFIEGGFFKTGDVLITLEDADRQSEVKLAQAEVARAKAALELEIARGKVAQQEWQSVQNAVAPELGLRKPQLAQEQANLQAAKANLERAQRNLDRTVIRAPFDGLVLSKNVDIGQFVSTGMILAEIASTDVAEVRLPLTDADLAYLDLSASQLGNVVLRGTVGGRPAQWLARLTRDEGVVNSVNRVIYAIAEVPDPYKRQSNSVNTNILRFGSFVAADISGVNAPDMVVLPRNLVRLDGTVLLVEDDKLRIRDVEVQRADDEFIYISAGLTQGDKIITSAVPAPFDFMPVRVSGENDTDVSPQQPMLEPASSTKQEAN